MSQELKYIVIGKEYPVIFPNTITHADLGSSFHVSSAGFCQKYPDGKYRCWGESTSIGVHCADGDKELLNKWFT